MARVHPRWKLRGVRGDKHLLRRTAARYLPPEIAARPKAMFRAPFADTFFSSHPPYVAQLLSHESLSRAPYFDPAKVRRRLHSLLRRSASPLRAGLPGNGNHRRASDATLASSVPGGRAVRTARLVRRGRIVHCHDCVGLDIAKGGDAWVHGTRLARLQLHTTNRTRGRWPRLIAVR